MRLSISETSFRAFETLRFDAAVALFRAKARGQIVVISSVAAFRGMPGTASSCLMDCGFSA
jgi:hypothetical protein